jgi:dTDP-4-dehydrorhamnose 3,5-epimerase
MAQRKKNPATAIASRLPGMKKDAQSVTADWQLLQPTIDGVRVKEVRHVPKESGHLTEIWRKEWALDTGPVEQVFQVHLKPGGVSAWHTHQLTTDRLFANHGLVKVVLYDARKGSPTRGRLNVFRIGTVRPTLIIISPRVWHGVENISSEPSLLLNLVDRAYRYEDPDHWRLEADSNEIPYRFGGEKSRIRKH